MFLPDSSKARSLAKRRTSKYSDEGGIDLLAWSWGMSQSGSFHVGGGGGAGKANFQDISCTKWIDKGSPVLIFNSTAPTAITFAKIVRAQGRQGHRWNT